MNLWLTALAAAAVLSITGWAAGMAVLRPLRTAQRMGRLGEAGVALALGLGLLSLLGLALALLGALRLGVLVAVLAALHMAAWRSWVYFWRFLRPAFSWRSIRAHRVELAAGLLAAGALTLLALYPPSASDATVYHLPYAESLLSDRPPGFIPELRFPVFPQAMEVLYAMAMLLGGELAAQLLHAVTAFVTAAILMGWGASSGLRAAGGLAAALWLGSAHLAWLASQAYVDVGLAMFVAAGWLAWEAWDDAGDRRWLMVSGAAFGCAAATKYLGLFFVGWFALRTMARLFRPSAGHRRVLGAGWFVAVALVVLAPWYGRIAMHTGSPLFPFYPSLFGGSAYSPAPTAGLPEAEAGSDAEIAAGLVTLARLPWDTVFRRDLYSWQPPGSPAWLILLPLVAITLLRGPPAGLLGRLAAVGAYGLFWLTLEPRDLRFLVPILPALATCVAVSAAEGFSVRGPHWLSRLGSSSLYRLLPCVLLLPMVLFAGYEIRRRGAPPATPEARVAYLQRTVPGFEAIHWLESRVEDGYSVYALYGSPLRYYSQGRLLGDWTGPYRYSIVLSQVESPRALAKTLGRSGIGWLLVRRGEGIPPVPLPPTYEFRRHFETVATGPDYLLYRLRGNSPSHE